MKALEECSNVSRRNKTGSQGITVSGHVECGENWISLVQEAVRGFEQGSDVHLNLSMIPQSAGFLYH